jgi:DNA-binding transcriptional LysR family regulator
MNYDLLKTFLSLAETKNFKRTSDLLFVSQPTVSARIVALENEVGQKLFTRSNRFVDLTPAGIKFLSYATNIYLMMNDCRTSMKNYDSKKEHITISAPGSCWDYGPLRQSILRYSAKHTAISIQLLRNVSLETLRLIYAGEVDVGIVYVLPTNADYIVITYYVEELLLLSSPKLKLPPQGDFLNNSKESLPQLVRPTYASFVSQLVEESLYMLPSNVSIDHPALYLEFVKQGFGIGLLQTSIAKECLTSGELVMVDCDYNKKPMLYKNYLVVHRKKEKQFQDLIDTLLSDSK